MDSSLLVCLTCVVTVTILYRFLGRSASTLAFPPGPPPQLFIGNLRHIPRASIWKTYVEWANTYKSDVISFTALGKRIVVLNSARATTDLLEKRSNIYSDRGHNVMLQDLIGFKNIAFLPYNDTFRLHRKVIYMALNAVAARDYYSTQEKETYALLDRLLETPDKWICHLKRAANSIILSMTYGHEVTTDDDYLVTLSEDAISMIRSAMPPSSFLVNMLPLLRHIPDWVPGLRFKRFAREGQILRIALQERPFQKVKDQIASGAVSPSYTTRLLEAKGNIIENSDIDEEEFIKETAAVMYGAGSGTSTTSVMNVILALILHPDVQKKVQAEIDAVVGTARLPTFADQSSLPYLQMVLAESLRWNPVTAIGIPHAVQRDDVYNGMFIPKGSIVVANIWSLLHDETMYPEPHRFWPERFDGRFPQARHPRNFAFGFGRRLCPGLHFALNSLFIQAVNLLAVYSFSKVRDEHGNEIEPVVDYSEGPPKPFECTITPRSKAAIALIQSTAMATAS